MPLKKTLHTLLVLVLFYLSLPDNAAAQYYFGRNKIQYDQFSWQVLKTAHFNIYYYQEEAELGQLAAALAEEAFRDFELKFNCTIDRKIPLVVYSNAIHFQETNILPYFIPEGVGGFFEFMKGRVVLPYTGSRQEFRHVVRHELVHVFTHLKIARAVREAGRWDVPSFPLWFIEGLAEWWSIGWDSEAELIIRDAVLRDYLYPLNSYELSQSGYLLYKEGQSFLRFFEQNYTADRLRKLMETYWQFNSLDEVLKYITGKNLPALMDEWRLSLKQEFSAVLPQETIIYPGRYQLTSRGANSKPTVFYADSTADQLIYLSNRNGYTDIYAQALETGQTRVLVKGERHAKLESLHFMQSDIAVNDAAVLAYVAKSGAQDAIRLFNIKSKKEIAAINHPELVTLRSPKWSPDNRGIVFSGQRYNGQADLFIWEIETNRIIELTDDHYVDQTPGFDPTGEYIVFSSDRNRYPCQGTDLYIMRLRDCALFQITENEYQNTAPFWYRSQPNIIYFLSDRQQVPNVWQLSFRDFNALPDGEMELSRVTDYHTGIRALVPVAEDTLIASIFQDYSIQIHQIPITPDTVKTRYRAKATQLKDTTRWVSDSGLEGKKKSVPYKLKYSLDFAQTAVAYDPIFGFLGGAQLSISDILGNRYYHFLLANTAETTSEFLDRFNVAVTAVDLSRRSNRAIGVFHFVDDYYSAYEGFYFERMLGVRSALNYPIDVFRRLEFSTSLWHSYKDYYFEKNRKSYLMSNYISFVHDNSIWVPTGPLDGWRARVTFGPTFDFKRSDIHNYIGLLDFRYYWRLHPKLTYAQRVMAAANEGRDIRRYYIGGSWGLRGYRITEIYGRRYILLNQELRFPFAKSLMLNFGTQKIGFAPLRGAVFFDAGNAWDYDFPGLLGSMGVGLRGVLFGGLVLRLDVGKKTDFKSIQKDWFVQFFFGWDY